MPEVISVQTYAGTAIPFDFNGLVRQYYLREGAHLGDIQVNLVDKHDRERKSHEIASAVRGPLSAIGQTYNASIKIVEVPPGPPVQAPLPASRTAKPAHRQTSRSWWHRPRPPDWWFGLLDPLQNCGCLSSSRGQL